jgi:adenylate cyclase
VRVGQETVLAGRIIQRRLSAIMAADVAGYSRLVARDEEGALRQLAAHFREVIEPAVDEYGGRIFKTMGDGFLAEFASVVGALRCALKIQAGVSERNRPVLPDQRLEFRIGLHTADVVVESDDILGDGVNIAARLEGLALPGGVCVSARVHEDTVGRIEAAFHDLGDQPLKNIPRPIRVFRVVPPGSEDSLDVRTSLPLPAKPSIAVMPFHNMSGDPEQEYFADALSEDIITALSRWRWFFVISRDTSFAYKDKTVEPSRVAEELGVRYVLQGSVRKAGPRVRVNAQLVDAASGAAIWAETFDRQMVDIFALQDELTEQVVGAIEPAMLQSENARVARKNPADLTAFDCFQRGMWRLHKLSEENWRAALQLFRQAIDRDPDLALGHVGLARALYGGVVSGWSEQPRQDLLEGHATGLTAIQLDPRDAYGYFAASGCSLFLARHREALEQARKTIALNPNFGFGHFRLGQVLVYSGRASEGVAPIERSIRYSPYDPQLGAMYRMLAFTLFHAGDYERAVAEAENALRLNDVPAAAVMAASLVKLGKVEEAQRLFSQDLYAAARQRTGSAAAPYASEADRRNFVDAVRLAADGETTLAR